MKYIFILLLLITSPCQADWFVSYGIGWHDENLDCPEACYGDGLMFMARFGWRFDNDFLLSGIHVSAVNKDEKGAGFNPVMLEKVFYSKPCR